MIGKITVGKSFSGCIKYCLNDKVQKENEAQVMKEMAEVILYNQCFGNDRELITQFNDVRKLNPSLSKPVLHITLSFIPGEQLANQNLVEMCQDCASEMGFASNQYIAILHKDTQHQHLHIVANRIGFDKRTVKDNNNYQKMADYCRKMELKYDLKQVQSPRLFLSQQERLTPRQNLRNEQLKSHIRQSLHAVNNFGQFEQKMKLLGYDIIKGRGIAFVDKKKVKIKGSEVGFSLMKIEKILVMK